VEGTDFKLSFMVAFINLSFWHLMFVGLPPGVRGPVSLEQSRVARIPWISFNENAQEYLGSKFDSRSVTAHFRVTV